MTLNKRDEPRSSHFSVYTQEVKQRFWNIFTLEMTLENKVKAVFVKEKLKIPTYVWTRSQVESIKSHRRLTSGMHPGH